MLLFKLPTETLLDLVRYPTWYIILFDKLLVASLGEALQLVVERVDETSQESVLPLYLTKMEVLYTAFGMA
jgi:hypothetical protein